MPTVPALRDLAERARSLAPDRRVIIGIAGAPGAGKSTLATALSAELRAPVVPMDGFHLRNARLIELGRRARKGAPETFDVQGYAALLRRLRAGGDVRAPIFDRTIEEPVEEAITVAASAPIVLTEGNYLLLSSGPWAQVRDLLDECWFISIEETVRLARLISRHIEFGRSLSDARHRATTGSDAENARLITSTSEFADLIIRGS
jgi:pantothenate kinase